MQALWSLNYDTEVLRHTVLCSKQNRQCDAMSLLICHRTGYDRPDIHILTSVGREKNRKKQRMTSTKQIKNVSCPPERCDIQFKTNTTSNTQHIDRLRLQQERKKRTGKPKHNKSTLQAQQFGVRVRGMGRLYLLVGLVCRVLPALVSLVFPTTVAIQQMCGAS